VLLIFTILQVVAANALLRRLLPGLRREPAVVPRPGGLTGTSVTVVVPTLNEAARLAPCLDGLGQQGDPLDEILVVDGGSTDGTVELVLKAAARDSRIRLVRDPPLPEGWIGKVWALQYGLTLARGEWILGVDADTEANAGMVAGVVAAANEHALDVVSFAPSFADQSAGERFLQPALLATLVYRFGAPSSRPVDGRILANGQCFLARRSVLLGHGGYEPARTSFADDVALASHYARAGVRCGFLDGHLLYRVRAYRSASEMWREWGRSVDLSDTVSTPRRWADIAYLALVQAAPPPILAAIAFGAISQPSALLVSLNGFLLAIRLAVHLALAPSYERRGPTWWVAWLADPAAVFRIVQSALVRPVQWRGRQYLSAG
jgi:dolichol-phosphate mannosyltransferase